MVSNWRKEYCGLGSWRPQYLQAFANIRCFTILAALLTVVQGIYLGYMIGVLTTIEKRFEIPSAWSGGLLSVYDFGHAISVLIIGHFGSRIHQPKWIACGAALSSVACFGLLIPHIVFGADHQAITHGQKSNSNSTENAELFPFCQSENTSSISNVTEDKTCSIAVGNSNRYAYMIFATAQLLAGIASSPFTTLAYVYIDDNATRKQSPFYMGIVTAMWAYGPALGFGLSSYTSQRWITLDAAPQGVTTNSPKWIGAWWLGLAVLCLLYLIFGFPFLFYPRTLRRRRLDPLGDIELTLIEDYTPNSFNSRRKTYCKDCLSQLADIPFQFLKLLFNPMVLSLSCSWIAGAYLFGGYSTFLPKYLEVAFLKPTFVANILGGIVAVLGVATSTAIGGKLLACLNPKASKALMLVAITFFHSLITFILLMFVSCDNPLINGYTPEQLHPLIVSNNFTSPVCSTADQTCDCDPLKFSPVCHRDTGQTYFSPCYLGCTSASQNMGSSNCRCVSDSSSVDPGYCEQPCGSKLVMYLIASFLGGAVGALFQMALFTNIIWAVPKEKKTNVVALSNFLASVFGFLPSQMVFGKIFDSTCVAWSVDQSTSCESGYCVLYNNRLLRFRYHAVTAGFQSLALVFVLIAHFVSRNFVFPKRDEDDEDARNGDELNMTPLCDSLQDDT